MQRQRDGLISIGDALSGLDGPVAAIRATHRPRRGGASPASIK